MIRTATPLTRVSIVAVERAAVLVFLLAAFSASQPAFAQGCPSGQSWFVCGGGGGSCAPDGTTCCHAQGQSMACPLHYFCLNTPTGQACRRDGSSACGYNICEPDKQCANPNTGTCIAVGPSDPRHPTPPSQPSAPQGTQIIGDEACGAKVTTDELHQTTCGPYQQCADCWKKTDGYFTGFPGFCRTDHSVGVSLGDLRMKFIKGTAHVNCARENQKSCEWNMPWNLTITEERSDSIAGKVRTGSRNIEVQLCAKVIALP